MPSHPIAFEKLLSFISGQLHADEADAVAAHVAGCPACGAIVARFREVQAVVRASAEAAPSAAVLARAKALFVPPRPVPGPPPRPSFGDVIRRVIGELSFDSRGAFALGGVRGSMSGYQLAFESEEADVDLQIEPPDDEGAGWRLLGQVDPHDAGPVGAVELMPVGGERGVAAEIDAHGVFALRTPPGHYDLVVRRAEVELVLPGLEIG